MNVYQLSGVFRVQRSVKGVSGFVLREGMSWMIPVMLCSLICVSSLNAAIDDPVAYWSFSDSENLLVNEVVPGLYNNATVLKGQLSSGVAAGGTAVVGNALILDGSSAIELPFHQDNLGPSFTIAMWYWQATNDTRMALYQTKDNWDASYEALEDGVYVNFESYVGQANAGNVTTGIKTWIHLVHSFSTVGETTTLSVYTNGVLALTPKSVSSNTMFNVYRVKGVYVGAHRDGGRFFKGMIDELALWNRALSASEATTLYQQGQNGLTLPVTQSSPPVIDMQNSQRHYVFKVDSGLGGGVYQNGWLADDIQDVPVAQRLEDAAARLDDTAGHVDGPFHAEAIEPKFKIPILAGLRNISQGDFSLETRFRTTDAARGVLIGNYTNAALSALNLELLDNNRVRLYFRKPPAAAMDMQLSAGSVNTRDGAWHHLAGIRKGSTLYLYLDGNEIGQTADTAGGFSMDGTDYFLKGDSRNDVTVFQGDMEDARFWTRALSTNELAALTIGEEPGSGTVAASNMLAQYTGMYGPHDALYASPRHRFNLVKPLTQMTRSDFTVETWLRSTSTERGILLGSYPARSDQSCFNLEVTADRRCRLYVQPVTAPSYSLYTALNLNIRDGQWHHLAGLRRDGRFYLYFDGQEKGAVSNTTSACSFDLTASYMYVGRDARLTPVDTWYDGDLKEARLWSRALTASEISSIYAGKKPGDPEVAIDGMLTEHSTAIWTNTLAEAGYEGSRFLRTYIEGSNKLSLVFENLPPHKELALGGLLVQLDSLDPVRGDDHLSILVDGVEVMKVGLGFDGAEEPQVDTLTLFGQSTDVQQMKDALTLGGENLFYCGSGTEDYNEHVYDLSMLEALQTIPHTSDTLLLELIGDQDASNELESFGVDQVEVTFVPYEGTIFLIQ